jgi:hypothetical protein
MGMDLGHPVPVEVLRQGWMAVLKLVRDRRNKGLAFAMGSNPRLGAESFILQLDSETIESICSFAH